MAKERKGLYWSGDDDDDGYDWLTFEGEGLYEEWWCSHRFNNSTWKKWQQHELLVVDDEDVLEGSDHQELVVPLEYLT